MVINSKYSLTQIIFVRKIAEIKRKRFLSRKSYIKLDDKLNTQLTKQQRKITMMWKLKAYKRYQEYDIKIKALKQKCLEKGILYGI